MDSNNLKQKLPDLPTENYAVMGNAYPCYGDSPTPRAATTLERLVQGQKRVIDIGAQFSRAVELAAKHPEFDEIAELQRLIRELI